MNRTILSLAILKTNWDKLQKDYLENFLPFVATLIVRKNYTVIDPKNVSDDFRSEFGLVIPVYPMISILKRAATRGLVRRVDGRFQPDRENARELDFTAKSLAQQRESEKVLSELSKFAFNKFSITLDEKTAEDALIAYLKDHDLDILFASEEISPLPAVSNPKKVKYIVNSFIRECFQREPEIFRFILDLTIGHALAATVLYREFNGYSGKFKDVTFYFDTRFAIRILGLEGPERQASANELLKALSEEKAKLRLFDKTLSEIEGVLYDCIAKLQKGNVDISSVSRVLRFFTLNNKNASDVEQILVSLKSKLADYDIHVEPPPDYESLKLYQIGEEALLKLVMDTYASTDPNFDKVARESMVRRDVQVLAGIFRIRRGTKPRSIKDCKAIFVTPNNGLAFAARRFEVTPESSDFFVPACVTDVFVGTLIWLQSPAKVHAINERRIIADCYAALQPSELLLKKYIDAVEQLKSGGKITADEYYLLRTHRAAINLLEEKTLGDPDAFDAKTPEEILQEIIAKIRNEERQTYLLEKDLHDKTKEILDKEHRQRTQLESQVDRRAEQVSGLASRVLSVLLFLICLLSLLYQLSPSLLPAMSSYAGLLLIVGLISGAMALANGFNILSFQEKLKLWLQARIKNFLKGNGA